MKRLAAALCVLAASGCGHYRDFTLPAPAGSPQNVAFRWEPAPQPVLARGAAGEWDAVDALNPAVARGGAQYFNLYSGFDGRTWHTGLAVSGDGLTWSKQGRVLSPGPAAWEGDYIAANGALLYSGGEFLYWYQAGRPARIGLARSRDGRRWAKLPAPVLPPGPRGSWDERAVADPYVVQAGGAFYLFYLGLDRARRQRLGVAVSADGVTWHKSRANPILELGAPGAFDETGLGEPAVWSSQGWYWMLYTGRDRRENRRIGLARSRDGVRWARVSESALIAGGEAWNARVVCDPEVEVTPEGVRVWFGGGDRAEPAENLNGQIGAGWLKSVPAAK
ncbi:MAG: hypothetical protein HY822_10585 [Acidobacteria bacterium]|nr:hypothetical protein [Acidobacteriota bacterium]